MNDSSLSAANGSFVKSPSHRQRFTYEHFPIVCPSCQGSGEINEDVNGLVTFVPVKDKRLRPAWTKLKVLFLVIAIFGIGVVGGYFIYPRSARIFISNNKVKGYDFNGDIPWIVFDITMTIENSNFFPVKIKSMTMQMFYMQNLVNSYTSAAVIQVGLKKTSQIQILMNVTYNGDLARYIKVQCYNNRYYVPQLMQSSAELSYWVHSEHLESKDDYFFTDCSAMVFTTTTTKALISAITTTVQSMTKNKTPLRIKNASHFSSFY